MNFLSKASEDRDPSNWAHQIKPAWCSPESPCSEALREKERMLQELRMRYDILYSLHQDVLSLLIDLKTKPKAQGAVFPSLDVVNEIVDREVAKYISDRAKQIGLVSSIMSQLRCTLSGFKATERPESSIPPIMKQGNLKITQEGTAPIDSVRPSSFYFSRFNLLMEKTKAVRSLQKKGSNSSKDRGHTRQLSSKDSSVHKTSDRCNSSKISQHDRSKGFIKADGPYNEMLVDSNVLKILKGLTEDGK
jgi:hypothetical protein